MRCWFIPIRPVTPFMMMPTTRCATVLPHGKRLPRRRVTRIGAKEKAAGLTRANRRALNRLAVIGCTWNESDALLERIELSDALLATDADDLVTAVEGQLHHVLPELPGGSDDADPHAPPSGAPTRRLVVSISKLTG